MPPQNPNIADRGFTERAVVVSFGSGSALQNVAILNSRPDGRGRLNSPPHSKTGSHVNSNRSPIIQRKEWEEISGDGRRGAEWKEV